MTRRTLTVDAGIAAAIVVLVLIISPGAAVTGMIAILVLVACALSFVINSRARRAARARRAPPTDGRTIGPRMSDDR